MPRKYVEVPHLQQISQKTIHERTPKKYSVFPKKAKLRWVPSFISFYRYFKLNKYVVKTNSWAAERQLRNCIRNRVWSLKQSLPRSAMHRTHVPCPSSPHSISTAFTPSWKHISFLSRGYEPRPWETGPAHRRRLRLWRESLRERQWQLFFLFHHRK